jgi:hypothetical protein
MKTVHFTSFFCHFSSGWRERCLGFKTNWIFSKCQGIMV